MSISPAVSIVIPTYNAARWLGLAVNSALAQSFADIEVLVFDNASSDQTPALMAAVTDPRCRYVRAEVNVGFAGNVTRGIRAAQGRYFMVLGADDILEPNFIAEAVARLDATPQAAMLHGRAIWIDDDGIAIGLMGGDWPAQCSGDEAFMRCFSEGFCYSAVISRTEPVKRAGAMDEDWGMISDSWLFLKLCLAGEVLFIDQPLVRYRVRESSLSFELFADGKMFDDHLAGLDKAFGWPEAAHLRPQLRLARVAVAQQALDTLHMTRLGSGFRAAWRKARAIIMAEPRVLLRPIAWFRLVFAALPPAVIRALRRQRRASQQARHAAGAGSEEKAGS